MVVKTHHYFFKNQKRLTYSLVISLKLFKKFLDFFALFFKPVPGKGKNAAFMADFIFPKQKTLNYNCRKNAENRKYQSKKVFTFFSDYCKKNICSSYLKYLTAEFAGIFDGKFLIRFQAFLCRKKNPYSRYGAIPSFRDFHECTPVLYSILSWKNEFVKKIIL